MPFHPDVESFVQSAVRLPHDRVRRIDRQWDKLQSERRVMSEVVQGNSELRLQMGPLREYITIAARMAEATGVGPTPARARCWRKRWWRRSCPPPGRCSCETCWRTPPRRPRWAFAALTAPFMDILPQRDRK
jgi:hypothetical protein